MRDTADDIPRTQLPDGERRPPHRGLPGQTAEVEAVTTGYGTMPVNERAYRRLVEPATDPWRRLSRPGDRRRDEDEPGYVIHLPIRVTDLATATGLARMVAVSLGFLPELDAGETTVSTADDQNNRHRVFCDLPLPDRSRCPQRYAHLGPCGELPPG
jgi:hypothetical protein